MSRGRTHIRIYTGDAMEIRINLDQRILKSLNQGGSTTRLNLSQKLSDLFKRSFDILGSLLGLTLLLPFFIIIGICIKHDTPGPVYFKGRRSAKGGGTFSMYKFRTMFEDPASYQGPLLAAHNDQRITPVGCWLRDTKINELPQLWNVLKGDMSLVGPRPCDSDIVATWDEDKRREILSVRPGITSLASVLYRDEDKMLDAKHDVMSTYRESIMPSKVRLDQLYVRNRSFWLDLEILIWTLVVVLRQHASTNESLSVEKLDLLVRDNDTNRSKGS